MATDTERANQRLNNKQAERIAREDIQWLMSEKAGRRIMWDLLAKAGVFRGSYAADPALTAFNEGGRNIGLVYLAEVMATAKDDFLLMLKEHEANG